MKPFSTYQHLPGETMTDRDKIQVDSKFWNQGKWDNFVLPFIKEVGKELTFVDMGCNAGVFLKLAEDLGFGNVVGVDSDGDAVAKGEEWRDENNGHYRFVLEDMNNVIDKLPLADYTVLANAHYYFTINDWLDYLDKLQYKTRYCIIVTAEKRSKQRCWANADIPEIRNYFKNWEEVGFIDELPLEGDPDPRRLWGLCFKSPFLERIEIDKLDSGNHVQDEFYGEIDSGLDFKATRYYRILKHYRASWGLERLHEWFAERMRVYADLKVNGLKRPIYIDKNNLILDGNHRQSMMKNLGFKTIIARRT